MFGIGWAELVFIGIAALLFLGPEKLPGLAQTLGKWVRELRAASADLRSEFSREFHARDWDVTPPQAPAPPAAPRAATELPAPPADGFGAPRRREPPPPRD